MVCQACEMDAAHDGPYFLPGLDSLRDVSSLLKAWSRDVSVQCNETDNPPTKKFCSIFRYAASKMARIIDEALNEGEQQSFFE